MSNYMANKTVLLPCDFSDTSFAAIDEAFGMIDKTTNVFVLHVLRPTSSIYEAGIIVDLTPDAQGKRSVAALKSMKERIEGPHNRTSFDVRIGDPGSEVVHFAKEIDADFIIMPSHGRTGIARLLLGSVAERVLRLAECPVIVLRHPKPKKTTS